MWWSYLLVVALLIGGQIAPHAARYAAEIDDWF